MNLFNHSTRMLQTDSQTDGQSRLLWQYRALHQCASRGKNSKKALAEYKPEPRLAMPCDYYIGTFSADINRYPITGFPVRACPSSAVHVV